MAAAAVNIKHVTVIGGGVMGSGIAMVSGLVKKKRVEYPDMPVANLRV